MKTLELKQMESVEGGSAIGLVGCIALGVVAGFCWCFACNALVNATPAY